VVECGGLEMFAANLDKSPQVSFEHAKLNNQSLSRLPVSYSVRKSVRRIVFLTGAFTKRSSEEHRQGLLSVAGVSGGLFSHRKNVKV
jgi:hypothetical protein